MICWCERDWRWWIQPVYASPGQWTAIPARQYSGTCVMQPGQAYRINRIPKCGWLILYKIMSAVPALLILIGSKIRKIQRSLYKNLCDAIDLRNSSSTGLFRCGHAWQINKTCDIISKLFLTSWCLLQYCEQCRNIERVTRLLVT